MKNNTFSFKILATIFLLTALSNTYSQDKKSNEDPLFGKNITAKSKNPATGIIRCGTVEYEQYLQEKNPKRRTNEQFENWLAPLVKKEAALRKNAKTKLAAVIITIPVVVHVIHNGEAVGTAPNITDEQVQSQITVLNQDFRKMLGTPGFNSNPVGADIEIEFKLAKQDPNGNPTNGIDRVNLCQSSWSTNEIESTVKPSTFWNPNQYFNMWTVTFSSSKLLGYAQFPSNSGLSGIDSNGGNANTDGVVSSYKYFGSNATDSSFLLNAPFDKGRTMTHEVGHWLGLLHIWGDGGSLDRDTKDCTASDYCDDTPQAGWENYDCPKPPAIPYDSCPSEPGNDMVENYMDYTYDACMNIFTEDQKIRMITVINNSPRRSSLITSTKENAISLVLNDAELKIEGNKCIITTATAQCSTSESNNKKVLIYNRGSALLTSASFTHTINGGGTQTYNWTGALASDKSASITLLNTSTVTNMSCTITTANGAIDQRSSNNSATATFSAPESPTNYNFTDVTFSLQLDKFGSEVSWTLTDGSGAIVKSSAIYNNKATLPLPTLITENWILNGSQCYSFTINDSAGDGICCGDSGNGYFELKSTTSSTIIFSGSEFGEVAKKSFTINTLSTNEFDALNEIYVHPNPTKGTLTIQIPNNFGLPNSYTISNVLGQKLSQKVVTKEADLIINTSSLLKGNYFITIVKGTQSKTLKFIKE